MKGLAVLIAVSGLLVGCGDDGGMPDSGLTPTWSSIYANLFEASCADGCHGESQLPLMETAASAHTNLVNVDSTTTSCAGSTYVVPMDPDNSLLVQVLGTGSCVARMPLIGTPLTTSEIDVVRTWIANGAENN